MLRKVALGAAILVIAAIAFAGLLLYWLSRTGRAQRAGAADVPALAASVEVRWDAWGVPHVYAQRGVDLATALGWLHANDRYLQMELGRRAYRGRLSELFGPRALGLDREAHTLRFREAAERLWETAAPETRRWLTAYAAGVNARMYDRRNLPPLLALLRAPIDLWTPVDSLGQVLLMARDLSFWQGRPEELRFEWLARFGAERTAELVGIASPAGGSGAPALHLPPAIAELAREWAAGHGGEGEAAAAAAAGGSNNWAVGASRSASGAPLVASDPHLRLRLPPVWFQAHLRSPDYEASGMTLPGLPGVVIGRSAELAWALTNVMLDDHDVFFERLDETGEQVLRGDGWAPVRRETVRIRVRGEAPETFELAATDIGPLLPADPERGLPARSLGWTAHLGGDPLSAFMHLGRAKRVGEVPAGIAGYLCPAQNLVVADRGGGLLQTFLGRPPARRAGDGRLPSPGWDPAYGWDGLAPIDASPVVFDPAGDLVVTANHDVRPPGFDTPADFDLPARHDRIRQRLAESAIWTAAALATIQTDHRYAYAEEMIELSAGGHDGAAADAWQALAVWDGSMATAGPAALFALFERELVEAALGDELDLERASFKDGYTWALRLLRGEMSPVWFDDARTPEVESRQEIVGRALARAWKLGRDRWGNDVASWEWGELHTLELRHPLGGVPLLGRLANRGPFDVPGSGTTVNALGGPWQGDARPVVYGPSMRWVADLGAPDAGLAVLPGGQAGHVFDPHFDDQLPLWLEGRQRPAPWSEKAIERATVSTLWLEP